MGLEHFVFIRRCREAEGRSVFAKGGGWTVTEFGLR